MKKYKPVLLLILLLNIYVIKGSEIKNLESLPEHLQTFKNFRPTVAAFSCMWKDKRKHVFWGTTYNQKKYGWWTLESPSIHVIVEFNDDKKIKKIIVEEQKQEITYREFSAIDDTDSCCSIC